MSKPKTFLSVTGLIYKESGTLYNTLQILVDNGLSGYCSPLHSPDEECKKEHYHINVVRPSRHGFSISTWRDIASVASFANNYCQFNDYPHLASAYLVHIGKPHKQQFPNYKIALFGYDSLSDDSLIQFGTPIPFQEYIAISDYKKASNNDDIFIEVIQWIQEVSCYSYSNLLNYAISFKRDWVNTIRKYHSSILSYMRSCVYTSGFNDYPCDKYSDKQERKVISIYQGLSDDTLNSSDIDCLCELSARNII